jgi:hypothetical protein
MPSAETVATADANLPAKHEYHVVPNSTHFAFLFLCPPGIEGTSRFRLPPGSDSLRPRTGEESARNLHGCAGL